jgi:7-keto-8-aminopelargonate synthetase-like enzyme
MMRVRILFVVTCIILLISGLKAEDSNFYRKQNLKQHKHRKRIESIGDSVIIMSSNTYLNFSNN